MTAPLVLVHWLHLLALALWIGGLAGLAVVLRAGRRVHPEDVALLEPARRRTRAILWWAVIALMVTLAAEIGLRTLATIANADTAFTTSLRTLLFGTRYGKASVAQWLALVASLWALDELGRAPVAATAGLRRWRGHALGIVAAPPRRPWTPAPITRALPGTKSVSISAARGFITDLNCAGICGAASPGSPCQKQVTWAWECERSNSLRSFAIRTLSFGSG